MHELGSLHTSVLCDHMQSLCCTSIKPRELLPLCCCRWYDLVLAAEDDIATIMTMEGGKPIKESKGEFASG